MSISVLTKDDFKPKTAREAARTFGQKVAITADAFERLSKENQARAFRIAGVHKARLIQRARDIVQKGIRDGTPFPDIRRALWQVFDTEGLPRPALARLRGMFRQNSMHAYSVARTRTLKKPHIIKAFPYWQYLTVGNGTPGVHGVRATHAALHGKVFRADDSFWSKYDPPWEWGCRCFKRALTPGQVERMGVKVIDERHVRTKLRVPGEQGRGVKPNPAFAFPRDSFDAKQFDLSRLDAELRRVLE